MVAAVVAAGPGSRVVGVVSVVAALVAVLSSGLAAVQIFWPLPQQWAWLAAGCHSGSWVAWGGGGILPVSGCLSVLPLLGWGSPVIRSVPVSVSDYRSPRPLPLRLRQAVQIILLGIHPLGIH